jgi:putative ABC transport system permease protein
MKKKIVYADAAFFKVFSFEFLEGNRETALSSPFSAVLTESLAVKFFGNKDPVNRSILIGNEKNPYS